jgi:hypothetical protein
MAPEETTDIVKVLVRMEAMDVFGRQQTCEDSEGRRPYDPPEAPAAHDLVRKTINFNIVRDCLFARRVRSGARYCEQNQCNAPMGQCAIAGTAEGLPLMTADEYGIGNADANISPPRWSQVHDGAHPGNDCSVSNLDWCDLGLGFNRPNGFSQFALPSPAIVLRTVGGPPGQQKNNTNISICRC